ncbi:MAG: hypothetical protein MJ131_02850 [Lachnospiraceae bacterium]|nr:hypothetical protein [Lachnospiraceae bacterium]
MKNRIIDAIGNIDDELLEATDALRASNKRKNSAIIKWLAAAACVCLAAVSISLVFPRKAASDNRVQIWKDGYSAEDYFKNTAVSTDIMAEEKSDIAVPYAERRYFSDNRQQYEADGVIPVKDKNRRFTALANYNEDGSLYSLELAWHYDSQIENYSHLSVLAGLKEVPEINDCIFIETDENGNVVKPGLTVTERDGIKIIARGGRADKSISFQNASGWYRISGSWNDSYEAVTELFEWFWAHPVNFDDFTIEKGDNYTQTGLTDYLNLLSDEGSDSEDFIFSAFLPDFKRFGYVIAGNSLGMKNNEPVSFNVSVLSNLTQEEADAGEYTVGQNGCEMIDWTIDSEAFEGDTEGVKKLEELTRDSVLSLKPADEVTTQTRIRYIQEGCLVTIYTTDVELAWELIESIR